jgi:hypothetical protein
MKLEFKKNENWGILSFRTIYIDKIEDLIREKLALKEKCDVDILDIKIEVDDDVYIIHVFYAREIDE